MVHSKRTVTIASISEVISKCHKLTAVMTPVLVYLPLPCLCHIIHATVVYHYY